MSDEFEFLMGAAFIGVGATVVMDLWAAFRKGLLGTQSLDYAMVGRWIGHLLRGRFAHDAIAAAAPIRGERAIGWIAHYATGIAFAGLLLAVWGQDWAQQPTLLPALVVGIGTVAAPFFIMQPGMGMGVAAAKTPQPTAARLRSLMSHTAFAVGLYGTAWVWALVALR